MKTPTTYRASGLLVGAALATLAFSEVVLAKGTSDSMMDECRAFATTVFQADPGAIRVKYEGRRTDGTHAVNGSVRDLTFQCSFRRNGYYIEQIYVNNPNPG